MKMWLALVPSLWCPQIKSYELGAFRNRHNINIHQKSRNLDNGFWWGLLVRLKVVFDDNEKIQN